LSIVHTIKEKCKGCYSCVRWCPSKAIRVENGLAEVVAERCVNCGTCLRICVPKAKVVESDIQVVRSLLSRSANVIAIPSSSFPAAFPEVRPGQLVSGLRKIGFKRVMEDAFGAEMVCRAYSRLFQETKVEPILSSTCPSVVEYVSKFYPQLVANLAPLVSPMIAMGRLIKERYDSEAKVVFVGPCVGKKAEYKTVDGGESVDAALTFAELKEMFLEEGVRLGDEADEPFSGPKPDMARLFAVSGGVLQTAGFYDDILYNQVISAHGREHVMRILAEVSRKEINARFISLFFCNGCIDGPAIDNELSIFRRRKSISDYVLSDSHPDETEEDLRKYDNLDLKRKFVSNCVIQLEPGEREIKDVLRMMGRPEPENQFDCGACGYRSCRELAVSVVQGQAEIDMCWPHMLKQLKEAQAGLIQAEKLTSLGQLAASIAHEINNPLSGVLVYAKLLAKKTEKGELTQETTLEYLNKMETELVRSTGLVRDLLDFARQSQPALREADLNDIVGRALDLVSHSASLRDIQVRKEFSVAPACLIADGDQLHQVAVNLILNAVQAMPEGGELTLRTGAGSGQLKFEVRDTGCGISKDNLPKLFTPFFTTKKKVKGVGLGLAVSYGIIQRHHGRIEVISKEGDGTTFIVYLPIHNEEKS
jgi:two-component system, NtrC family, sensor kinase